MTLRWLRLLDDGVGRAASVGDCFDGMTSAEGASDGASFAVQDSRESRISQGKIEGGWRRLGSVGGGFDF